MHKISLFPIDFFEAMHQEALHNQPFLSVSPLGGVAKTLT
jgi:hypothetical protein